MARLKMTVVPGSDVAGIVEAVGRAATGFRPGDEVYAVLPAMTGGGYAGCSTGNDKKRVGTAVPRA